MEFLFRKTVMNRITNEWSSSNRRNGLEKQGN